MRKRSGGLTTVGIGVVALVVTLIAVYLGFTKSIPFWPHYEVKAAFKSANNLRLDSPVRIAGVEVGKVAKVERASKGDNGVLVTMRLNKNGRPLHRDARFKIRPRIFLEGNFFVDVQPGHVGKEVDDGHTFPVNQTETPVQLDEVLDALQSDSREDLKIFLREYAAGLRGKGARGFNRSIKYWKPAYRDTAIVSEAMLGEHEHDLSGYIRTSGRRRRRARPQPGAVEGADHELPRDGGRVRAREREPRERDRRAAADAASRDARARRAEPLVPAAARASRTTCSRASSPPPRRSTSPSRCSASCAGSCRSRSCEGWPTTCARRFRRWRGSPGRACRSTSRSAASASCQNDVILPWCHDTLEDEKFPADRPGLQRAAQALPGPRGREPLRRRQRPVVPGARRRRHEPRAARAGHVRHDRAAAPRRQPAEAEQPPAAAQRRPVREPAAAGPALQGRRAAAAAPGRHNDPAFQARWAEVRQFGVKLLQQPLQARGPRRQLQGARQEHHGGPDRAARRRASDRDQASTSGDFAAIIGLIAHRRRRVALHPQRAADALPVPRAEAVRAQGRVLDRAGRGRRPGPDRARLRRADRRHRRRRARGRPRVVAMDIDPEYKDIVHTDATALLRPKTGLKDMFIDLQPGHDDAPVAKEGFTIPIRATQPDVNPDEILSALDADTRDYLKLLLNGAGQRPPGPRRRSARAVRAASSRPIATSPGSTAPSRRAATTCAGSSPR